MALVGALLLVCVLLIRPQEFIPALQPLSLLNVLTALTGLGIVVELFMGKQKSLWTPQLPWLAGFLAWAYVCTIFRLGVTSGLHDTNEAVLLAVIFMLLISFGLRSFARYRAIAAMLIVIGLFISAVCIHLAQQPAQCIVIDTTGTSEDKSGEGEPDGRLCEYALDDCEKGEGGDSTKTYECEKAGLFGTFTEGHRVRWRGTLGDPNELAVLVGAIIPFLFAFNAYIKKKWFTLAVGAMLAVFLYTVVLTGSRGGQLVVLTVFGFYFVRRYGARGVVIGVIFALPVLMFGGREGEEAESSSLERAQLLYDGMDMIRAHPIFGVGVGQFVENSFNYLTAHNSYVLAAAEMGMGGSILWSTLVYVSIKIPFVIANRPPPELDPRVIPFARALVVSFAGILVGVFFLSFCYKQMLFIYFGLSGALYGIARQASPSFRIGVGKKEIVWLIVIDVVLLAFVFVYSRIKGTG